MPPALSDEEASVSADDVPYEDQIKGKEDLMSDVENGDANGERQAGDEDGDEDGSGDGDEEEYIVEAILSHGFEEDVLKYEVKWYGYEKKSDRTWEPEDNLSGAKDLLAAYHKKIGGRPKLGDLQASGRKRKQSGTPNARSAPKGSRKNRTKNGDSEDTPSQKTKIKTEKQWSPPLGLWEDDIIDVESVEQSVNPSNGERKLLGYVRWGDGHKTQHSLETLYRKCPQKMLQFYERHLVFKGGVERTYDEEEEAEDEMQLDA